MEETTFTQPTLNKTFLYKNVNMKNYVRFERLKHKSVINDNFIYKGKRYVIIDDGKGSTERMSFKRAKKLYGNC